MTEEALDSKSFLIKYVDFDPVEDKYMAISLNYRGKIKSKEANETVQKVKKAAKVSFVEWMPTGFKIGLNDAPPAKVEGDPMEDAENTCVMIGSNLKKRLAEAESKFFFRNLQSSTFEFF